MAMEICDSTFARSVGKELVVENLQKIEHLLIA